MRKKINKKAFTLIEMLVVIAIIGVLASIVAISIGTANSKSRDARRKSDLDSVNKALNAYSVDNFNKYPICDSYSSWVTRGGDTRENPCWCITTNANSTLLKNALVTGNYLPVMPLDPQDEELPCGGPPPQRECAGLSYSDNRGYIYGSDNSDRYILGTNLEIGGQAYTYSGMGGYSGAADNYHGNYQIRVGW